MPKDFMPPETGIKGQTPQFESPSAQVMIKLQEYKEKCLPLPDNFEEVFSGGYREGTYAQAAGIVKFAPNPCEASVELKLFLESNKGEWTIGKYGTESKDMGLRMVVSALFQKYILGMAVNPTLTIGIKLSQLVDEELKKRDANAPIKEAFELFRKTRGMKTDGIDQVEAGLKERVFSLEKDMDRLTVKYGQKLLQYKPNHPYNRLNPSTAWQIYFDKELQFAKEEAAERGDLLYKIASLEIQRGVLNQYRRPLAEKSCEELMAQLQKDCTKQKELSGEKTGENTPPSLTPEAPVQTGSMGKGERDALNYCICRCTISPTIGVGATWDPNAWKNASPSCDDARNGPCVGFGLGCWRKHMDAAGECFENCVKEAKAGMQEVIAEIRKTKLKAFDDFIGEARKIIEDYLILTPSLFQKKSSLDGEWEIGSYVMLAANFADGGLDPRAFFTAATPGGGAGSYVGKVKEKNRRGDPDKALALVRAAEAVMPDRKASGETTNILAEFAIMMSKASLNIVTELEFDEGLYLLRKAAEYYKAGEANALGQNIKRLTGNFEKWKKDWQTLRSEVPQCISMLKDKRLCECEKLREERITPASNSFVVYEQASPEKWEISRAFGAPRPIPKKDNLMSSLNQALQRTKQTCASVPALQTKEMKQLEQYDTRKTLEKSSYINQEELRKSSAPVISDEQAIQKAEKLAGEPGLCDCDREKIKGILETAKEGFKSSKLEVDLTANKKTLRLGEYVRVSLMIRSGRKPYTYSITGDLTSTVRGTEVGSVTEYPPKTAGTKNVEAVVTDAAGDSRRVSVTFEVLSAGSASGSKGQETQVTKSGPGLSPPLYDPTKDPNIKEIGKPIDIAKAGELSTGFQDATGKKKTSKTKPPVTTQSESYTGSGKKPGEGESTQTTQDSSGIYPPSGPESEDDPGKKAGDFIKNLPPPKDKKEKDDSTGGWTSGGGKEITTGTKGTTGTSTGSTGTTTSTGTKTGSTGTSGSTITAVYMNQTKENAHIFTDGEAFGPNNRLISGEKRNVKVKMLSDGRIKFYAGRNGKVIDSKYWAGTGGDPTRYPMVKFVIGMGGKEELVITTNLK